MKRSHLKEYFRRQYSLLTEQEEDDPFATDEEEGGDEDEGGGDEGGFEPMEALQFHRQGALSIFESVGVKGTCEARRATREIEGPGVVFAGSGVCDRVPIDHKPSSRDLSIGGNKDEDIFFYRGSFQGDGVGAVRRKAKLEREVGFTRGNI